MPEGENTTPEGLTVGESGLSEAQAQFINENFRGAIPEEFRSDASLADYNDIGGLVKSHINAQKMIGNPNTLVPPNEKSTPEEWTEFNLKMGMPAEAKDYGLTAHEGATEADIEWFSKIAHERQLSKKQANDLWNEINTKRAEMGNEMTEKQKQQLQESHDALVEEWGGKENYKKMVEATNKGLARMDDDGKFRAWMKQTGLNKQPEMLRFAAKVSQLFNEDRAPGDTRPATPLNKDQAKSQLNKIFSDAAKDPKHALMNKKDPAHEDMVKKVTKLSEVAGGGGIE